MAKFYELAESDDFKGLVSVRDVRGASFKESLGRAMRLLNDTTMSRHRFGVAIEEAFTTTDFPILLGTIFEQTLLAQYNNNTLDWKEYINTGTQSDFRPTNLVNVHGLTTPLMEVAQHGEYQYGNMTESKVQTYLKKYGKLIGVTWEDIINDRYGVFRSLAGPLAKAAQKTEFKLATGMFSSATGPNTNIYGNALVNPIDGVAISNLVTLDLTSDNLAAVIAKLRNQTDADGDPIIFEKVHIVVPPALEFRLWGLLSASSQIVVAAGTTAAAKSGTTLITSENMLNRYTIVPHVNSYLPSVDKSGNVDKTWYAFVDPADAVGVQVQYLAGHEAPEVFVKAPNQNSAGGGAGGFESFENDTQEWKVRHVLGGSVVDGRATVASVAP